MYPMTGLIRAQHWAEGTKGASSGEGLVCFIHNEAVVWVVWVEEARRVVWAKCQISIFVNWVAYCEKARETFHVLNRNVRIRYVVCLLFSFLD